jgi:hypothetical protein
MLGQPRRCRRRIRRRCCCLPPRSTASPCIATVAVPVIAASPQTRIAREPATLPSTKVPVSAEVIVAAEVPAASVKEEVAVTVSQTDPSEVRCRLSAPV